MAAIRGVLIDLSGTIHVDNAVISGSITALQRLRNTGVMIRFVTNTTKESKGTLVERLHSLGFGVKNTEVFTSLTAARRMIEKNNYRPFFMLEYDALKDFQGISGDEPNAVVVGLSPTHFNYDNMNQAFTLLLNGCPLIAVHKARYHQRHDGLALGPGPFVAALEYASDCKSQVIGKPEKSFFKEAISDMDIPVENTVMIGDDILGDISGAQNIGIRGILVKTGKYRSGDETRIKPGPVIVCENFSKAVDYIHTLI